MLRECIYIMTNKKRKGHLQFRISLFEVSEVLWQNNRLCHRIKELFEESVVLIGQLETSFSILSKIILKEPCTAKLECLKRNVCWVYVLKECRKVIREKKNVSLLHFSWEENVVLIPNYCIICIHSAILNTSPLLPWGKWI